MEQDMSKGRHDAFERMLSRAMGKVDNSRALNKEAPKDLRAAQAIVASQKGRKTLFKRSGRPGVSHVVEEFNGWQFEGPFERMSHALFGAQATSELAQDLVPATELVGRLHSAWAPIAKFRFPSLHDAYMTGWDSSEAGLLILFDGYFSNGENDDLDRLGVFFEQPMVKALWRGQWAKPPGLGVWAKDAKDARPFIKELKSMGKAKPECLIFSDVPWIMREELSLASEEHPAMRLCFTSFRELELEVSGASARMLWGKGAIQAFKDSRELQEAISEEDVKTAGARLRL
jgi:hypothetical protein